MAPQRARLPARVASWGRPRSSSTCSAVGHLRAAPGRLTSLSSDPTTGVLELTGEATAPDGELVVWTPTTSETHTVAHLGLADIDDHPNAGGRIITARVVATGAYSFSLVPNT